MIVNTSVVIVIGIVKRFANNKSIKRPGMPILKSMRRGITIRSVARDELVHRSGALAAGEALLVVDVTHRGHLLGLEHLTVGLRNQKAATKPKF